MNMKIVLLGAGNVATHIGIELRKNGAEILQVYSRSQESAQKLSELLGVSYCCNIVELRNDADVYLYALKDDILETIIAQINIPDAVHVHTAGSISVDVFKKNAKNYGVLYPLQTFSKDKTVDFSKIPLFIEANNDFSNKIITNVAKLLSPKVNYIDSEKRKLLHLSAVFACNFSNFMYVTADKILSETGFDYRILLPLINETTDKLNYLSPKQAQTGPAARKDKKTIKKHIDLLQSDADAKKLYQFISKMIERNINNK